jgi:hypothetical protein
VSRPVVVPWLLPSSYFTECRADIHPVLNTPKLFTLSSSVATALRAALTRPTWSRKEHNESIWNKVEDVLVTLTLIVVTLCIRTVCTFGIILAMLMTECQRPNQTR